jgi:hypothetical protein
MPGWEPRKPRGWALEVSRSSLLFHDHICLYIYIYMDQVWSKNIEIYKLCFPLYIHKYLYIYIHIYICMCRYPYGSKHCLRRYGWPPKSYPKYFLRRHLDP